MAMAVNEMRRKMFHFCHDHHHRRESESDDGHGHPSHYWSHFRINLTSLPLESPFSFYIFVPFSFRLLKDAGIDGNRTGEIWEQ